VLQGASDALLWKASRLSQPKKEDFVLGSWARKNAERVCEEGGGSWRFLRKSFFAVF
jgi:hypothetical protein